mgnify:CR=1 FL=1
MAGFGEKSLFMHTPSSIFRKEHPKDGCEKNTRKTATKRTHERRLRKEYPKEKPTFSQSCSWRNIIISESQRSLTKEPRKGASQRSLTKEPHKGAPQRSPTKEPRKGASHQSLKIGSTTNPQIAVLHTCKHFLSVLKYKG